MKNTIQSFFKLIKKHPIKQFPSVTIPNTHIRKIVSKIVADQEYILQIHLPFNYNNDNKNYPVVYLLDAQWDFPIVVSAYGQQYFDGTIPELIIVGITWGGSKPDIDKLRMRDYTLTREGEKSNGVSNFSDFIKNELFPFIENNYRADKEDKKLMCCSLASSFVMYTLFKNPKSFNSFVISSPTIAAERQIINQYNNASFKNKINSLIKLFITVGELEYEVSEFEELVKVIQNINFGSLQFSSKIIENTGHSSVKSETYSRGLKLIFEKPDLNLDLILIQKYLGAYQNLEGSTFLLKLQDNKLLLIDNINRKYILKASSNSTFYSTAKFLNIEFKNEKTLTLILNTFEKTELLTKK